MFQSILSSRTDFELDIFHCNESIIIQVNIIFAYYDMKDIPKRRIKVTRTVHCLQLFRRTAISLKYVCPLLSHTKKFRNFLCLGVNSHTCQLSYAQLSFVPCVLILMLRYEQRTTTICREIDTCYVRLISVRLLLSIVHFAKCLSMFYRHLQRFCIVTCSYTCTLFLGEYTQNFHNSALK